MGNYEKAVEFAREKHRGQVDKAGKDYILHPIRISQVLESDLEKTCAVLHDVVEDTNTTLEEVEELFGKEVAEVVDALSHRKGEPYVDYIRRVKQNKTAKRVKFSDLSDNLNLARFEELTDVEIERVKYKYIPVLVDLIS